MLRPDRSLAALGMTRTLIAKDQWIPQVNTDGHGYPQLIHSQTPRPITHSRSSPFS
jgi:hypothetical protein